MKEALEKGMKPNQKNYIKKYLEIDDEAISKKEDLILNLLFYKTQYEKQKKAKDYNNLFFTSNYNHFSIKEDITKPIYEYLNCKPRINIEWPDNKKFAVVLTHDVDLVYPSWKYRYFVSGKSLLNLKIKKALNIFMGKYNLYWTFRKIISLEEEYDAKSSFYFLTSDRDIIKVNYQIEDLEDEIGFIKDKYWEVGLHGGFYSYNDLGAINDEKRRLERVFGEKVIGYRNHYLRFKVPDTWELLSKAGFKYDTTFGYNDMVGFRNGMCHPFKPFNLDTNEEIDIIEIPLTIMDGALEYMKLSLNESWEICKRLIDITMKYKGVITILWHNTSFDDILYKNRERIYSKILKYCHEKNAWMTSGEEIWMWWTKYGHS